MPGKYTQVIFPLGITASFRNSFFLSVAGTLRHPFNSDVMDATEYPFNTPWVASQFSRFLLVCE